MSKRSRSLSAEEQKLWRLVTRNVKPYRPHAPKPADEMPPGKAPPATRPSPPQQKHRASLVSTHSAVAQGTRTTPGVLNAPVSEGVLANIDRRTGLRLKRGQMPIDGRIDLHGLSLSQAHATLAAFLRRSYARGARCVVVVTGKGRGGEGIGKIRSELPHWLNQSDVRNMILAFTQAQVHDGGAGAFYVLLKRNRAEPAS